MPSRPAPKDRAQNSHSFHKDIWHQIILGCYCHKYRRVVYKYCQNAMLKKMIKLITWLVLNPCYHPAEATMGQWSTFANLQYFLLGKDLASLLRLLILKRHCHCSAISQEFSKEKITTMRRRIQLWSCLLPKRILRGSTMVIARISPIKTTINTLALAHETTWKCDHY